MYQSTGAHWTVTHIQCDLNIDLALWVRAALGISVPPHSLVPGPLADLRVLPIPGASEHPQEFGTDWLSWWLSLVTAKHEPATQRMYAPPQFEALSRWPHMRASVMEHWESALHWHVARKQIREPHVAARARSRDLVEEIAQTLKRPTRPFRLELFIIPVSERRIRAVTSERYLVPEMVYKHDTWPSHLRAMLEPLA